MDMKTIRSVGKSWLEVRKNSIVEPVVAETPAVSETVSTEKPFDSKAGWAQVRENASRKAHYKGATKPEGLLDKEGEGAKKFAKMHTDTIVPDNTYEKGHDDSLKAQRAGPKASSRNGTDNLTNGDNKIVKPVAGSKAKVQKESEEESEEEELEEGKLGSVYLGGQSHEAKQIPIKHHDEYMAKFPGSKVKFYGQTYNRNGHHTSKPFYGEIDKKYATHFGVVKHKDPVGTQKRVKIKESEDDYKTAGSARKHAKSDHVDGWIEPGHSVSSMKNHIKSMVDASDAYTNAYVDHVGKLGYKFKTPKVVKEDTESLLELSKSTLASYISGAKRDIPNMMNKSSTAKKLAKHSRGVGDDNSEVAYTKIKNKYEKKARGRWNGIGTAFKKMAEDNSLVDAVLQVAGKANRAAADETINRYQMYEDVEVVSEYTADKEPKHKIGTKVTVKTHVNDPIGKKYVGKKGYVSRVGSGNTHHVRFKNGKTVGFFRSELDVHEGLDESMVHNRYLRVHGKKASGKGHWGFTDKNLGTPSSKEVYWHAGEHNFSDAKKGAVKHFGHDNVFVMEDYSDFEEFDPMTEEVEILDENKNSTRDATLKTAANPAIARYRDKKRNNADYHFTTFKGHSDPEVAKLKAKHKGTGKKVVLVGRIPKSLPAGKKPTDRYGNITGGSKNAARHDVYVRDRNPRHTWEDVELNTNVEQIDELKKSTIGSYIRQATTDHDKSKNFAAGARATARSGRAGPVRSKEWIQTAQALEAKTKIRAKGLRTAWKKLEKEEVEGDSSNQITELSKSTLGSYVKKAAKGIRTGTSLSKSFDNDATRHLARANRNSPYDKTNPDSEKSAEKYAYHSGEYKTADKLSKDFAKTAAKRITGINAAVRRLTKEDTSVGDSYRGMRELNEMSISSPYAEKLTSILKDVKGINDKNFPSFCKKGGYDNTNLVCSDVKWSGKYNITNQRKITFPITFKCKYEGSEGNVVSTDGSAGYKDQITLTYDLVTGNMVSPDYY